MKVFKFITSFLFAILLFVAPLTAKVNLDTSKVSIHQVVNDFVKSHDVISEFTTPMKSEFSNFVFICNYDVILAKDATNNKSPPILSFKNIHYLIPCSKVRIC